jgi:hypothetical protein
VLNKLPQAGMARVAVVVLVVVACTGAGGPAATTAPTSTLPAASSTPAGSPVEIVMCTLMPLADVQAASPFTTPLADSAQGATPGMCEYVSGPDADQPVGVLLSLTDFGTPDLALTHMTAYRQNLTNAGVAFVEVGGVGDQAVSSGSDEVGVHTIVGSYALDANLGGEWPDTPDSAKLTAGTSLLQTLIARLP